MQTEVDQLSEVVPTLTDREGLNEYKAPRYPMQCFEMTCGYLQCFASSSDPFL